MGKLSDKRERFVREYLVDLNATRAATRAGYSPKTADRQGHRLLKNAEVATRVADLTEAMSEKLEITAERVLQELGTIAFEGGHATANKLRALELLGKHLAMFTDRRSKEYGVEPSLPAIEIRMV